MRIVAVEEHFTFPDLLGRIDLATLDRNGWPAPGTATFNAINPPALADTGRERIAAMDAAGIRMQMKFRAATRPLNLVFCSIAHQPQA
jgi:uncharacterized protein